MSRQFAVGIMTGTSLDGVDLALVALNGAEDDITCELLHFISLPLANDLKERLQAVCHDDTAKVSQICSLNCELGELYNESVTVLLNEVHELKKHEPLRFQGFTGELDFIASHGQTIYHLPQIKAQKERLYRSTLQIGDPSMMALTHQTDVYFNFRMMDIAGGGDGAPLVPMTEWLLYCDASKNRLLQNIGGIGNVTILPSNSTIDDLWAFDTGPGNMMINDAMQLLFNRSYDDNGEVARQGAVIPELLAELKAHPYLSEKPPKSTGRELFGRDYTTRLLAKYSAFPATDIIHTFTRFTAYSIAESYRQFIFPVIAIDEVIIGGGGAYNLALIKYLQEELPAISVLTNEDIGISSDAKEAIAFALLGYLTKLRQAGNVPRATGAKETLVLGQVCPNPFPKSAN